MSFGSNQILPGKPLYRGQGNGGFQTSDPRSAAKRGQSIPYDVNGAPSGAALADGDYGDIVASGGGMTLTFDSGVVTAFARTFLDDADAPAVRLTLGLGAAALASKAATSSSTYSAPSSTYVAPAGGATVDTEGRASLAQLAADVSALRTALGQAATDIADMRVKMQAAGLMA